MIFHLKIVTLQQVRLVFADWADGRGRCSPARESSHAGLADAAPEVEPKTNKQETDIETIPTGSGVRPGCRRSKERGNCLQATG